MRGLIHTYVAYCEQKCWIVIEVICKNMQIQEKCAMVLFDKFFDHKLDGEIQSRVTMAGSVR